MLTDGNVKTKKTSLKEFIKENSDLLKVLGVFFAVLSLFSRTGDVSS